MCFMAFITLIALNLFFTTALNGLKDIKNLIILSITRSIYSIIFTVIIAYWLGVKEGLIASNFVALIIFFVNLFYIKKIRNVAWKLSYKHWDKNTPK